MTSRKQEPFMMYAIDRRPSAKTGVYAVLETHAPSAVPALNVRGF